MRLSVVIPAYNEEDYIEKTIRALQKQSFGDLEIIVVDNNSTDSTVEKVKQFPEVKLFQEKNRGVQFARERGRLEATGEIIANLDADCLPKEHWAETGMKYFEKDTVAAISGPYIYSGGSLFFRTTSFIFQHVFFPLLHLVFLTLFGKGAIAMGGNIFMRRTALDAIGGYNTKIAFYGDDTDTINRLAKIGKVIYTKNIAVYSSTRRFDKIGAFTLFGKYLINYFWVVVFREPYHKQLPN